jgi:3-dehydroquinate dehydratase
VSVFIGGSAMSMAKDIAEGYIIVSEHTFKKFQGPELQSFLAEVEKLAREIRSVMPAADDMDALQRKNRKLQRLTQAQTIVNAFRMKHRR